MRMTYFALLSGCIREDGGTLQLRSTEQYPHPRLSSLTIYLWKLFGKFFLCRRLLARFPDSSGPHSRCHYVSQSCPSIGLRLLISSAASRISYPKDINIRILRHLLNQMQSLAQTSLHSVESSRCLSTYLYIRVSESLCLRKQY